jgi:hypothetical protein
VTFESIKVKNVHVLGDSIQPPTGMPKVGVTWRTSTGRSARRPVVALLSGQAPNPGAVLNNTCYSFITGPGRRARVLGPPVRRGEENRVTRARLGGLVTER